MAPNGEHSQNEPKSGLSAPVHERALTTCAVAARYGVRGSTVQRAITSGELPHFRVGNLIRVRPLDVPQFLSDRWSGKVETNQAWPTGRLVYFLGLPGFVKIGCSSNLARRVTELQPGSPYAFELLAYLPGGSWADERVYHKRFHAHRCSGEWFALAPEIEEEIFTLNAARDAGRAGL